MSTLGSHRTLSFAAAATLGPLPITAKQQLKNPVQVSITRTLLLVSSVFLILNSPFHLSRIYLHLYMDALEDRRPVSSPLLFIED